MNKTHVSHGGCLTRIDAVITSREDMPEDREFISFGYLVNPKGNYSDAPHVALYRTPKGHFALS